MPDLRFECRRPAPVAGIDEAGRGPWAGPVVAAAVTLDAARLPRALAAAIDDSKRLTGPRRATLMAELQALARCGGAGIGVGQASVAEIDGTNILAATMTAMARAVAALPDTPAFVLVDGDRLPSSLPCPGETVVKGDARCLSIAAASIVAKVTRDRIMGALALHNPGYGWERNAGYGTAEHRAALGRLGPTRHHRASFAPVKMLMEPYQNAG